MTSPKQEGPYHYDKQTLLSEHGLLPTRIDTKLSEMSGARRMVKLKFVNILIEANILSEHCMKISELSPKNENHNSFIYSKLISTQAECETIRFIVEDEFDNVCRVSIPGNTDTSHLVEGVRLLLFNPIYRMAFDGKYSLIVHDTSDLFILGMGQYVNSYSNQEKHIQIQDSLKTSIISPPYEVTPEDGFDLSEIGNKFYIGRYYIIAIILYTSAIKINDKTAKFYSNRALCYNKLEEFENALSDFQKANLLDPDCVKYQYWVALTWSRIGNHRLSLDLLKKIHTKDEVYISSVNKLIHQERLYLQNIHGVFDIKQIVQNLSVNETTDKVADYIGPIQMLNSSYKGRGLFTTRNVKKGENLCVVKATEIMKYDKINCPCLVCKKEDFISLTQDKFVHEKLMEKARKSKLTTVRIISLCDRSITNVNIDLYSGCGYEFAKNFDTTPYPMDKLHSLVVDNICSGFNHFEPDLLFNSYKHIILLPEKPRAQLDEFTFAGIWLLPSFINHSCIPNVVKLYVGNICIVRAITDIPEGEEVFCNYTPLSLFPKVEDRCAFLNFLCTCKLCVFERRPDVRRIILRILALEDRLKSYKRVQSCFQIEMRRGHKEITTEVWLDIKDKMVKQVKKLLEKQPADILLPGSFQTSLFSLLFDMGPEIDALDLLVMMRSYFTHLEPEPYFLFWSLFSGYILDTDKKLFNRFPCIDIHDEMHEFWV